MPDLSNSGQDFARRRRGDKARVLASAVIGLIGGFTVIYFGTLSLFIKPITEEFSWGRTEVSALAALAMIGNAVGAPIAGRLAERHGSRPIVAGSGVVLCIGLVGLAAAPANQVFFAVAGLSIGVLSAGTTTVGHLVNLPRFFEHRLGMALAIVMAGSALGPAAVQLITNARSRAASPSKPPRFRPGRGPARPCVRCGRPHCSAARHWWPRRHSVSACTSSPC
jgi:predicted MFS family arabinose efflux permease